MLNVQCSPPSPFSLPFLPKRRLKPIRSLTRAEDFVDRGEEDGRHRQRTTRRRFKIPIDRERRPKSSSGIGTTAEDDSKKRLTPLNHVSAVDLVNPRRVQLMLKTPMRNATP